jgi:hypothetical protein
VTPILTEVRLYYRVHTEALKSGDPVRIAESSMEISEWSKESYPLRVIALEDEARRLIGTKRHWRSTRRGRVVVWLRKNTAWLAAVPLPVLFLILAGLVVYFLIAR